MAIGDSQGSVRKDLQFPPCCLLGHGSGGGQLPCFRDTQAALGRGLHGNELGPFTNSQNQFALRVSEPSQMWILSSGSLFCEVNFRFSIHAYIYQTRTSHRLEDPIATQ